MSTVTRKTEKVYLDLKTFRELTKWSVYKIHRETDIPLQSLYNYLKDESDPKYREPKLFIKRLLGEIYSHMSPPYSWFIVVALSFVEGAFFCEIESIQVDCGQRLIISLWLVPFFIRGL